MTARRDADKLTRAFRASDLTSVTAVRFKTEHFGTVREPRQQPRTMYASTPTPEIIPSVAWRALYKSHCLGSFPSAVDKQIVFSHGIV